MCIFAILKILKTIYYLLCMCYVCDICFPWRMCGGQTITRKLFLSTLWVPGVELGLLGLTVRTLPTELFCLSPPIVRTFHHMHFTVCFVFLGDRNSWLHGQVVLRR